MRISVWEAVSAQAHSALTGLGIGGNAMSVGFALHLGAGDLALGWCAAIPTLATFFQLVAGIFPARLGSRKKAVAILSGVSRALWLPCAALALLAPPGPGPLLAFLVLWLLSHALISLSGNLWVAWMAELVPARVRPRYFAFRTAVCTAAGILVGLAAGFAVDHRLGSADGRSPAAAFAAVFLTATLFGAICSKLLMIQAEPQGHAGPDRRRQQTWRELLIHPFQRAWQRPAMRGLLYFVAWFGFTNGISAPFWQPFQIEQLKLSYTFLNGTLVMLTGVAATVGAAVWGTVASRWGSRNVVVLTILISSTHPLYFLFSTPERTWPMYLDAISAGVMWSGYNLCVFNLVLQMAEGPQLGPLFAVYATVAGGIQAVAAVLAGALIGLLPQDWPQGWLLDRRQLVFAATSLFRLAAVPLFLHLVPSRPAKPQAHAPRLSDVPLPAEVPSLPP